MLIMRQLIMNYKLKNNNSNFKINKNNWKNSKKLIN
jgi:hypothetical protein